MAFGIAKEKNLGKFISCAKKKKKKRAEETGAVKGTHIACVHTGAIELALLPTVASKLLLVYIC